jgi:hypothetical protein
MQVENLQNLLNGSVEEILLMLMDTCAAFTVVPATAAVPTITGGVRGARGIIRGDI